VLDDHCLVNVHGHALPFRATVGWVIFHDSQRIQYPVHISNETGADNWTVHFWPMVHDLSSVSPAAPPAERQRKPPLPKCQRVRACRRSRKPARDEVTWPGAEAFSEARGAKPGMAWE
jgi:hypothetical protein